MRTMRRPGSLAGAVLGLLLALALALAGGPARAALPDGDGDAARALAFAAALGSAPCGEAMPEGPAHRGCPDCTMAGPALLPGRTGEAVAQGFLGPLPGVAPVERAVPPAPRDPAHPSRAPPSA